MKKSLRTLFLLLAAVMLAAVCAAACACTASAEYTGDFYAQLHLVPTAGNPKVEKIVVRFDGAIEPNGVDKDTFTLTAASEPVSVTSVYVCNDQGERSTAAEEYLAYELKAESTPDVMQIIGTTRWAKRYRVKMELNEGHSIDIGGKTYAKCSVSYDAINDWVCPQTDVYAKDKFEYRGESGTVTLQRSLFTPEGADKDGGKNPLIVWLHGYGEGGTDINIPMLNSNAVALSSPAVQSYFQKEGQAGAFVAFVQTPTLWLDSDGTGENNLGMYTGTPQDSYYTDALNAAIDDLLSKNDDIDSSRVYIAGCSNGGYMTLELALHYGNKYAAYVPICEAYMNGNISDASLNSLKNLNIWFVHSDDDPTVDPYSFTLPTYYRLLHAGAENVHLTYLTGFGHNVWGQFFEDKIDTDFDAAAVKENFNSLIFSEQGAIINKEDCFVRSENCTVEAGSVFAWLALQHSA